MELEAPKMIGAGLATIGVIGAGIGVGSIFASAIATLGRNPAARDEITVPMFLGFALTEAVALFALLVAFLILFT